MAIPRILRCAGHGLELAGEEQARPWSLNGRATLPLSGVQLDCAALTMIPDELG
jgi:hypothetical protein